MRHAAWICAVALCTGSLLVAQERAGQSRDVECFAVIRVGASSEAQSLYLRQMGFGPEALRGFAPPRFARGSAGFSCRTDGAFGYDSGTPVEVARRGDVILYRVAATVRSAPPPRAAKTLIVDIRLSELARTGDLIQPGIKAMDLASSRAGWDSGLAWVLSMKWRAPDVLRATVGLTH